MMKQALLLLLIGLAVVRAMPQTNEDVYDEDTIDDSRRGRQHRRRNAGKTCKWIGASAGSDGWCRRNCNHNPPYCPAGSCKCTTPTPPPTTTPPTTPPPTCAPERVCGPPPLPPCRQKLKATFVATDPTDTTKTINGTIEVIQSKTDDLMQMKAIWKVKFQEMSLCPSGQLNWHVHQTTGNGLGPLYGGGDVCVDTGGHYDPLYACGPSSDQDRDQTLAPYRDGGGPMGPCIDDNLAPLSLRYRCSPSTEPTRCEVGDQSGKMGKLVFPNLYPQPSGPLKKRGKLKTQLDDYFMPDIRNLEGRSLVLHCCSADGCGERIACADLVHEGQ